MTQGDAPETPGPEPAGPDALGDWMALWRSELSALAEDRELRERWNRLFGPRAPPAGGDEPAGEPEPGAPWPASAFPAPFGRDAELERLRERVLALERRLDQLERR